MSYYDLETNKLIWNVCDKMDKGFSSCSFILILEKKLYVCHVNYPISTLHEFKCV